MTFRCSGIVPRFFLIIGTVLICLSGSCSTGRLEQTESLPVAPSSPVFKVQKGTNISHWLSQSSRRGDQRRQFFTREDVEYLSRLGFDHIRIPVDEEQLWDESGRPDEEAFGLLESALEWCEEFGLKVVIDLHILRSHHFIAKERPLWTSEAAQQALEDCWLEISRRFGDRSVESVAYELMNEPVADDPDDWNRLVARLVKRLRKEEPDRVIVIGSNRWQSVDTFDQLRIPEGEKNILLSFHMYIPMPLTHYKASWTTVGKYEGPVRYPGPVVADEDYDSLPDELKQAVGSDRDFDRQKLLSLLNKPLKEAKATGLPLYCGEWGCLPSVPREDRLRWYRDVRANFEAQGIAWATWDYKGSFGIRDQQGNSDDELIETLLGSETRPVTRTQE